MIFCNKFCLIFAANIMYIYAFMCANIFGAIVLKPRFKIDTVIMIIQGADDKLGQFLSQDI